MAKITQEQYEEMQNRINKSKFIALAPKKAEPIKLRTGKMSHEKVQLLIHHEKRSKYGVAKKSDRTHHDGTVYDSKLELKYRIRLDVLRNLTQPLNKRVVDVIEQKKFVCIVNDVKICSYFLDFAVQYGDGRWEHIDCKGIKTPIYRLKKKLVESLYPIKIIEITAKDFKY